MASAYEEGRKKGFEDGKEGLHNSRSGASVSIADTVLGGPNDYEKGYEDGFPEGREARDREWHAKSWETRPETPSTPRPAPEIKEKAPPSPTSSTSYYSGSGSGYSGLSISSSETSGLGIIFMLAYWIGGAYLFSMLNTGHFSIWYLFFPILPILYTGIVLIGLALQAIATSLYILLKLLFSYDSGHLILLQWDFFGIFLLCWLSIIPFLLISIFFQKK